MPRRAGPILICLGGALVAACLLRLAVGGDKLGFAADSGIAAIRWLRVACGVSVGAGLAVAGVMLQALLRNPLASPDLLGLSAGASLALMLAALLISGDPGRASALGMLPAAAGSLATLALVYAASQRRGFVEPVTLVLVGVIAGLVLGSASSLAGHLMPDGGFRASRLIVGTLSDDTPWPIAWAALAAAAIGTLAGIMLAPAIDAAAMGDDEAVSVGVRLPTLRLWLFLISGMLTAVAVVIAGPIAFVGLVVPHAARLLLGPSHRVLFIAAAILGAITMVLADAAVRSVNLPTGRVPVGIVTAMLGGPVFVVMLRSMMRRGA
jgi:iron complex transport system permease protein